jgi:alpha/beta superfamily hydrolase
MQLMMRRPEITGFISVSPPASTHDFTFLAPCPVSGLIVQGGENTQVTSDRILNLVEKISKQKGVTIDVGIIEGANEFFSAHLNEAMDEVERYVDAHITQMDESAQTLIG